MAGTIFCTVEIINLDVCLIIECIVHFHSLSFIKLAIHTAETIGTMLNHRLFALELTFCTSLLLYTFYIISQ